MHDVNYMTVEVIYIYISTCNAQETGTSGTKLVSFPDPQSCTRMQERRVW